MTGQQKNKDELLAMTTIPRALLIVGPPRYGKRTFAQYIAKHHIGGTAAIVGTGIDDVRAVIASAYKALAPVCYIFPDCENMTVAAVNALLKVVEELPRQAHFILTASNDVLPTLKSRCHLLTMNNYTEQDLKHFTEDAFTLAIASSPGEVQEIEACGGGGKLYAFCDKVYNQLGTVSGVNALKIPGYLSLKKDAEGFNPEMFMQGLQAVILDHARDPARRNNKRVLHELSCLCSYYKIQLVKRSIRKDALLDMWVLDAREIYEKEGQNYD